MKEVKQRPTEGQFIATWGYKKQLWCGSYKWIDGRLYEYDLCQDDFIDHDNSSTSGLNARYYIRKEK